MKLSLCRLGAYVVTDVRHADSHLYGPKSGVFAQLKKEEPGLCIVLQLSVFSFKKLFSNSRLKSHADLKVVPCRASVPVRYPRTPRERATQYRSLQFFGAVSVLQALQSSTKAELDDLASALTSLCKSHKVTLQWTPAHCNIHHGNDMVDELPQEGATKMQEDKLITF
ncbi:hypothetical protein ElyMa_003326300 [Elysia marginata]|uniref:RNase H type-1 domain-containing protein n=1 Tax=Elysia marginata TaxID=1093978 RepID=A0AAV4JHL5_9GAST|nr:hypothetical protein ElyMa_003326300 [Elysia marginata]